VRRFAVPWWGDLGAVVALALLAFVLALVPLTGPLRTAALLPLVLILPGYALVAALFMPGEISRELRVVLSVPFSVGASVLGGVVVQLVIGLDRPVWAALLASATVVAAFVALRRRDGLPADDEPSKLRLPRLGVTWLLAMLGAIAVAGWAIAIATDGVHRQQDRARFSSLWLVPEDPSAATDRPVRIGVSNQEGRAVAYRLTVRRGARTVAQWPLRLEPAEEWEARLAASAISGTGPLVGRLDRSGHPYRRVALQIGANG
jgi:uncharacterized membrane protein